MKKTNYVYRQELEEYSEVYDLTSFLDNKYYIKFIHYLIETRNPKEIMIDESLKDTIYNKIEDYSSNIDIFRYKNSNVKYNLMIILYKLKHSLVGRAIIKIIRRTK